MSTQFILPESISGTMVIKNDGNTLVLLPDGIDFSNPAGCDTISIESLGALVERTREEMKRKEIISHHKPPIRQLPSGRYYTRIKGKKVERTNLKDVEDAIVDSYLGKNVTICTIFDDYMKRRKADVLSGTWSKDILYHDMFYSTSKLYKKPLSKLTLDDGYEFLEHCLTVKPDMKRRYWNNIVGCLNQLFQYAIDKGYINQNPFRNMKPKKDLFAAPVKTRDGDTVFTKSEQFSVCRLAEEDAEKTGHSEPLGIILLFNLGIRIGELCAIKWGDIETNRRRTYIHIQREMVPEIDDKGKAHGFTVLEHCKTPAGDRRLQLNEKAMETFDAIRRLNEAAGIPTGDDDYVFLRLTGKAYSFCNSRSFDPRLRKYCRQSGMSVIKSPHDIRRTVLTNLYEAGMPLKKIQEYAGHSSLKQTMDYIRISDEDLDMSQYLSTLSAEMPEKVIEFRKNA